MARKLPSPEITPHLLDQQAREFESGWQSFIGKAPALPDLLGYFQRKQEIQAFHRRCIELTRQPPRFYVDFGYEPSMGVFVTVRLNFWGTCLLSE